MFINTSKARGADGTSPTGDITLNFIDTEIAEVLRAVFGDTLKINYVIDPKVAGTLTLKTNRPIRRQDVLPTLEAALRMQGFAIVRSTTGYHVIPVNEALKGRIAPRYRGKRGRISGYGVEIVPLRHASAGEMERILEPFAPKGGVVRTDGARNLLMIAGTQTERAVMADVIETFDVDWFKGMSFALLPLRFSDPASVIDDVRKILDDADGGPLGDAVRLQPVERMNAILVATANPSMLDIAREWIERFDIGSPTKERRLFVYRVQNGRANDLADVLSQIFGGSTGQSAGLESSKLAPGLKPVTLETRETGETRGVNGFNSSTRNSLFPPRTLLNTTPRTRATESAQSNPDARPSRQSPGQARTGQSSGQAGPSLSLSPDNARVRIISDETNNSLLIMATPSEYRDIEAALKRLDIVPLQVLIEATIAEVTLNDTLKYGVQWFFNTANTDVSLSEVASGAVGSSFPGFSALYAGSADVRAVLNALDSVTDVKVVSTPQLLVLDNRTAELQVGDQVPVATQSAVNLTTPDAPVVNSIEFRDTGVVLKVTPHVNASGLVILDIEQEVSDVISTTTSGIDSPTIQQRRISSSVAVHSEETVALGGLIRNRQTDKTDGVPFLSQIPFLGALFGATEDKVERTELLVLIKPRVVRDKGEARAMTEELKKRVKVLTSVSK